jgi:hypothetical protein
MTLTKNFANILAAIPWAGPQTSIGDDPPLTVSHNPGTGSLIFALNNSIHITIYQNSWDGTANITDFGGHLVSVGPYCLHLTAGTERWFRQYQDSTWIWVTDYGTPTERSQKTFYTMLQTILPYIK